MNERLERMLTTLQQQQQQIAIELAGRANIDLPARAPRDLREAFSHVVAMSEFTKLAIDEALATFDLFRPDLKWFDEEVHPVS